MTEITKHQHYLHSSYREKMIEHLFVGELLKYSWKDGSCNIEISKPEVDQAGYDLVVEKGSVIRHIQLKCTELKSSTANQKVHVKLAEKPAGCVLWIVFDESTMELGPFLFYGNAPGQPLDSLEGLTVAKHTKGNAEGVKAERPNVRVLTKGKFEKMESVSGLMGRLFGREV